MGDPADDVPDPEQLLALLRADDVDGAIEAGLMRFATDPATCRLGARDVAILRDAQQRLRSAWEARDRYRARQARLARIAAEREARRHPPAADPGPVARPALPAAAASALARALAKAGSRDRT